MSKVQQHRHVRTTLGGCRPTNQHETKNPTLNEKKNSHFAELHHQIHQRPCRVRIANVCSLFQQVCNRDIGKKSLIQRSLSSTELHVDINLDLVAAKHVSPPARIAPSTETHLVAEFVLHMSLHAPQHERFQDHVQSTQLMFVQLATFVLCCVLDILREPLIELVVGIEKTWHNEVQQGPEF